MCSADGADDCRISVHHSAVGLAPQCPTLDSYVDHLQGRVIQSPQNMGRRTQVAKGGVCKTSIQRFDSARRLHLFSPLRLSPISFVLVCTALSGMPVPMAAFATQTRAGVVDKVDKEAGQIVLSHGSATARYEVHRGTVLIANRRPAVLEDFAPGMKVQVRFQSSSNEPFKLYDLTDAASWPWLQRVRRDIVTGTVTEVTPTGVVFEDAKEQGQLAYRVTQKSRIQLGGKPVNLAQVPRGARVWIAPRLLPNGAAFVVAMADTEAAARRLKERAAASVKGTIVEWNPQSRTITLSTVAGDRRSLVLSDDCVIRRDGRDVTSSSLTKGSTVTAHVRRTPGSAEQTHRITILGSKRK